MLKVGGRELVSKGINDNLDYVSGKIIKLLNQYDIDATFTHGGKDTWNLILCDEENRECVELKINDDDRIFRV